MKLIKVKKLNAERELACGEVASTLKCLFGDYGQGFDNRCCSMFLSHLHRNKLHVKSGPDSSCVNTYAAGLLRKSISNITVSVATHKI